MVEEVYPLSRRIEAGRQFLLQIARSKAGAKARKYALNKLEELNPKQYLKFRTEYLDQHPADTSRVDSMSEDQLAYLGGNVLRRRDMIRERKKEA